MKSKFINGPINCIRLEGQVNSIKKVLYLFMDFHEPIDRQTECEDVFAQDIKTHFIKTFSNIKNNKTYDFFFEIHPSILLNNPSNYKNIYIAEVQKLFLKEFNVKKNKVDNAKHFPNLRLHYIDIRDYISSDKYPQDKMWLDDLYDHVTSLFVQALTIILTLKDCEILKKILDDSKKFIDHISELIKNNSTTFHEILINNNIKEYSKKQFKAATQYIINKIFNKYKHDNIQKTMNTIIKKHVEIQLNFINDAYNDFDKQISDCESLIKKTQNMIIGDKFTGIYRNFGFFNTLKFTTKFLKKYFVYYNVNSNLFSILTDFYFLRRFLDKDYVTNAIGYTGGYHSLNYIFYLVKYFDFKITHWSFLSENINDIIDKIKLSNNSYDLTQYFIPPNFYQCTNLSDFPEDFE